MQILILGAILLETDTQNRSPSPSQALERQLLRPTDTDIQFAIVSVICNVELQVLKQ